ncbi:MAG: FG-GAP-like repeat-containing protein [Candidatus Kapaibacteriales bacterium]
MKSTVFFIYFSFLFVFSSFAREVELINDNGRIRQSGYPSSNVSWEESKIIKPDGPCYVKKIRIYFYGSQPRKDTIFIVGDPSEGVVPPTLWVEAYNRRHPPIIFDFTSMGWYEFPVDDLRLDGLDRIVIQHRLKPNGPWFAMDDDGLASPYSSFLMNPSETNSLGGPGNYHLASADYLVRIVVEYLYPDGNSSLPPPPPQFLDVTESAGLFVNGSPLRASDVSVVDLNNDGFDDLVIGNYIFYNNRNGTFRNMSDSVKIVAGMTSWGDFNNDGWIDCYALVNGEYREDVKMVVSRDRVYKNNGNGTFSPISPHEIFALPYPNPSKDFRLPSQFFQDSIPNPYSCITPLWTDLNNDGRLDLYLANNRVGLQVSGQYVERYFPDQIWIQGQDGKFYNVTDLSGMTNIEVFNSNPSALGYYDCYGASACDYNYDGKVDIFVANYRLAPDFLLKNSGDETFTNVGSITGVQGLPTSAPGYFGHGMGCEWGDLNNDGWVDLVVGNLGHPDWRGLYSNPSLIFINNGPPNFDFVAKHREMGLKFFEMNAGFTLADFNLDGNLDLWHGQISYYPVGTNNEKMRSGRLYFNEGEPDFKLRDVTWEMGTSMHGAWSGARVDFDGDGDMDLVLASNFDGVRLFRNDIPKVGNFVGFLLSGDPNDNVSMDCYGTKVLLFSNSKVYYRDLMGSVSGTRCTQSSHLIHFGLGNLSMIDSVIFLFPNGKSIKFTSLQTNHYYKVYYNLNSQGPHFSYLNYQLRTPRQIYPSNFQTGLPNNIILRWQGVGGSNGYLIEVSENPLFEGSKLYSSKVDTFLLSGLQRCSRYWWRLRAIPDSSNIVQSEWSSIWSFVIGNPLPKKVNLVFPKDSAKAVALLTKFVWNSSNFDEKFYHSKLYYLLEISKDYSFNSIIFTSGLLSDTLLVLSDSLLEVNQTYFWRVKAINEDSLGFYSNVFTFSTNVPPKVQLISPKDGEIDVGIKPTYKWEPAEYAIDYQIEVSNDSLFNNIVYAKTISSSSVFQVQPLTYDTKYFWHVRGRSEAGYGNWSSTFSFKTIKQTSNITDHPLFKISVSPNPFSDVINIELNLQGQTKIQIINLFGINIFELTTYANSLSISTTNISNGMYLVRVINSGKVLTIPVFKIN